MFLNDIKEKNLLEKFIELEELFFLDEIIKEYPETHIQKLCIEIHKETIQLVKMHNEGHIHSILHFSTNIICFAILSGYSILGNEERLKYLPLHIIINQIKSYSMYQSLHLLQPVG